MISRISLRAGIAASSLFLVTGTTIAAPWDVVNFKHVEADPKKAYELTEKNGPWVIMAATFTGDHAEDDAHALVLDLRKNFALNAYYYAKTYDFSKPEPGLGVDMYGSPKVMRHLEKKSVREVAVVVGDFPRVDDSDAQAALKKIKQAQPDSLKTSKSLSFADYRQQVHDHVQLTRGPFARAFVAPNPLIPTEYFAPKGPDKFVLEMNRNVEHSLLDCPGKYTLQVATFKGNTIINQQKIKDVQANRRDMASSLDISADRAHRMTVELRKLGYEAYEYHDRESSMVTYGHFDSIGNQRADGTIEPLPQIQRAVETFGIDLGTQILPLHATAEKEPKSLRQLIKNKDGKVIDIKDADLVFDIEPTPIVVPKRSIAADYARRN